MRIGRASASPPPWNHGVHHACLSIVGQGAKSTRVGDETYVTDESRMMVATADLPVTGRVIRANPAEPFLYVQLDLAPDRIAALTPRVFPHGLPKAADYSALDTHDTPPEIVDAVVRLMQLIAHPDDIDLLAPLIVDEILIRLLRGRRVHASRRSVGRFDDAAHLARRRLDTRPLPRPDDGRIACAAGGHGPSTFHYHFRAVTSMARCNARRCCGCRRHAA